MMPAWIASRIHFEFVGTLKAEHDAPRIGSWADDEVVLQLALVAVIGEVDAMVDVLVLHLGIRGHIGPPLVGSVANEVVRLPRQFLTSCHAGLRVSVEK